MSIAHDDPRLTAYALGELAPEEMQTFRAELAEDPRARAEVSALRELGGRLERELRSEPAPRLSTAQHERIWAALEPRVTATGPDSVPLAASPGTQPEGERGAAPVAELGARRPSAHETPRLRWWRVGVLTAALVGGIGSFVLVMTSEPEPEAGLAAPGVESMPRAAVLPAPASNALRGATLEAPAAALSEPIVPGSPEFSLRAGQVPQPASAPLAKAWGDESGEAYGGELRMAVRSTSVAATPHLRATPAPMPTQPPELFNDEKQGTTPPELRAAPGNGESYDAISDNPFLLVTNEPRSTFSIDVDTASYALVRRFLSSGSLPPRGAVRIEELLNYFSYRYPEPSDGEPFRLVVNLAQAPWAPEHQLVRIGLQARHVAQSARPPANLVFLIDVSGSMNAANKLELVKYGLRRLTESLGARDRVAIVVYAGASGLVLPATAGDRKGEIQQALAQLEAGGSTNGGQGIELAYSLATQNFIRGGVNRVLLATDGDFNVGVTSESDLVELIQGKAKSGVFLSVLGFGAGNYQDSMLEKLADKGNGNYAYVDEPAEAEKVLVEQATGTLVTVAKDVKLQLEFNPAEVTAFRLLGYENRLLEHQDFNDDSKDAGEVGAGHSVTALYEVIPTGGRVAVPGGDFKYVLNGKNVVVPGGGRDKGELLNIKLRYQPPEGGASRLKELALRGPVNAMDEDFRFAAALAEFGMLLRQSPHRGQARYEQVLQLAQGSLGDGKDRQAREQFVQLVRTAHRLTFAEGPADKPRP